MSFLTLRFCSSSDISSGEGAAATCKSLTQRITGADDLDFLIHIGDVRDCFYLSQTLICPPPCSWAMAVAMSPYGTHGKI